MHRKQTAGTAARMRVDMSGLMAMAVPTDKTTAKAALFRARVHFIFLAATLA
jgi:hypothetical protein